MTKTCVAKLIMAAVMAVSVSAFSQQPPSGALPPAQPPLAPQTATQQQPIGRPPAPAERYNVSGDRIVDYFDVHAAELRSVLRQLSAYSGRDIISNDDIKATVTLSVTNKSWREILAIVCMVHSLAFVEEPSFIYVMTREQAATYASAMNKAGEGGVGGMAMALDATGPLVREVIPMRFTTAAETGTAITPFLSQRGKLTSIKHTNAIVIVDTDDNLRQLKNLVAQIDVQTPQITISCKIIEASSEAVQNMGVHWGFIDGKNNVTVNQFGSTFAEFSKEQAGIMANVANTQHTVTYGLLTPDKFGVALEYLFQDNKAEIVAQPQITTLNNEEAKVEIKQSIPILRKDDAANTVTEMVDSKTMLKVTPYVSGEGKIRLMLEANKGSYELTDNGAILNDQNAQTKVLVNNGETVVIAGLTSNEKKNNEAGIPYLKNIPIIGYLFKRSQKTTTKRDLVIFITPYIIHSEI
jgi:type IV pilus secretin PilQ/predicted competence protein